MNKYKYKYKEDAKGIIINIKHGALKEGPGWRSIVYFKGCNFYCPWLGNILSRGRFF